MNHFSGNTFLDMT